MSIPSDIVGSGCSRRFNYVWRLLSEHNIDLVRKSCCESNDAEFGAKAVDVVGLYIARLPRRSFSVLMTSLRFTYWSGHKPV
jgi:hypothetical protein